MYVYLNRKLAEYVIQGILNNKMQMLKLTKLTLWTALRSEKKMIKSVIKTIILKLVV